MSEMKPDCVGRAAVDEPSGHDERADTTEPPEIRERAVG